MFFIIIFCKNEYFDLRRMTYYIDMYVSQFVSVEKLPEMILIPGAALEMKAK